MFCHLTSDNLINVTLGSSLVFFNMGVYKMSGYGALTDNKCANCNFKLASVMGSMTGVLMIYKGLKH